ncbi:hypothetical protein [Vibrio toranzoniae]|nr:hypothetical protein [Vibrio toranzoniae]
MQKLIESSDLVASTSTSKADTQQKATHPIAETCGRIELFYYE